MKVNFFSSANTFSYDISFFFILMDENTKEYILHLLKELMSHPIVDPFIGELYIDEEHEEIYLKKVKREVDLELIYKQVQEDKLKSVQEITKNIDLIWSNIYITHEIGNFTRIAAEESQKIYKKIFKNLILTRKTKDWYQRVFDLNMNLLKLNQEIPDSSIFNPRGIDMNKSIIEQLPSNAQIQKLLNIMKSLKPNDHKDLIDLINEQQPELSLKDNNELSIFALNPSTFKKVKEFVDERTKKN